MQALVSPPVPPVTSLRSRGLRITRPRLAGLVDHGLAHRLEPAGLPTLYEQGVGDNHHHLVCRECRVDVDVDCVRGPAPYLDPDDNRGFVVDEAEVTYRGHRPDCQTAAPDHGGHA